MCVPTEINTPVQASKILRSISPILWGKPQPCFGDTMSKGTNSLNLLPPLLNINIIGGQSLVL
jgi:hypothetical protein